MNICLRLELILYRYTFYIHTYIHTYIHDLLTLPLRGFSASILHCICGNIAPLPQGPWCERSFFCVRRSEILIK